MINFHNFASTKICTPANLLRMVDSHKNIDFGKLEQHFRYRYESMKRKGSTAVKNYFKCNKPISL